MSTSEIPAPGQGAGIHSQIEFNRAKPVVFHNSRLLCCAIALVSMFAAALAVCMALMVVSLLYPAHHFTFLRAIRTLQWAVSACAMSYMSLQLWRLARTKAGYQVVLDGRGVNFKLGTKRKPSDLFLAWDQIAAIKCKPAGNSPQYLVQGSDGSEARFSSYTFFRPAKVVCLIAERAGLSVQKA